MGWPVGEEIERIDGRNKQSILILRAELGVSREKFGHEYCSELLRSAIASSVSALDRYLHDALVHRCITLLRRRDEDIPRKLKELRLPVLTTKKALEKLRADANSRPGAILKKEIQDVLHKEHTFQNPHGIETCASMLGISSLWTVVAREMPGRRSGATTKDELRRITRRRNQIVHESDLILQTSASRVKSRPITRSEAVEAVKFVKDFVQAFETVAY